MLRQKSSISRIARQELERFDRRLVRRSPPSENAHELTAKIDQLNPRATVYLSIPLLPTGFDRSSANGNNNDLNGGNQDPTSPEVGKKTIGISAPNSSITAQSDVMC